MAQLRGNVLQISFRGDMPVGVWQGWRKRTLEDIGRFSVRTIRGNAPAGYGRLREAATFRITNQSGRKDNTTSDSARFIDLRPRIGGNPDARVHHLYHIAEGGRKTSVAGWNKMKAKSGEGRTGRNVLAMRIGGKMVYRPMARGYRGTRFLRKSITGPIFTGGGRIVVHNLENYAIETKRVG